MERLKWSLGFRHGVTVDCKGKSGGLALLWRDGVAVSVRPWCQYYVDTMINQGDTEWRFTGIYGEPLLLFDGAQLTREIILLRSLATALENLIDVW
jgi:hypothetical protein